MAHKSIIGTRKQELVKAKRNLSAAWQTVYAESMRSLDRSPTKDALGSIEEALSAVQHAIERESI